MKKIFGLFFILVFITNLYSQNNAPSFKIKDIFGNIINSDEIRNENKFIFIDFFMNSCGGCQYMVPFVDSTFKYFGCNCSNIYFVGISIAEWNDDFSIFNFRQNYEVEIPLISGASGGANIANQYGISYVPYFALINPDGSFAFKKSFFVNSTQQLLDSISQYNLIPSKCQNADFIYFEVIDISNSYIGTIDLINHKVLINVPQNFDFNNYSIFFIKSPKSQIFIENQHFDYDTLDISGIDFNNQFKIVAEDSTVYNNWQIEFSTTNNLSENNNLNIIFDPISISLYLFNYHLIKDMKIYNIKGNLLFETKPSSNIQNLNMLNKGIYILSFSLKNNQKTICKKIIIK